MNQKAYFLLLIFLLVSSKGIAKVYPKGDLLPFKAEFGKWGYIDEDSKEEIITDIYLEAQPFMNDMAVVRTTDRLYGVIDTLNNYIVHPEYTHVEYNYFDDNKIYLKIRKESGYGIYDLKKRKELVPCEYQEIQVYPDGYMRVKKNEKWGYVNSKVELITSLKYDDTRGRGFDGKYAIVSVGQLSGIIDRLGTEIIPTIYDQIISIDDSTASFIIYESHPTLNYEDGATGKIKVINKAGTIVYSEDLHTPYCTQYFSCGLLGVADMNGKYGFVDGYVNLKIPYMYDNNMGGFIDNLTSVYFFEKDDMDSKKISSAVIDTNNKLVIPFIEGSITVVSDSLFIVRKGKKLEYHGVCDRNQKTIIKTEYDQIDVISDSLFKVKKNGLYAIYDIKGNQVQPHKYSNIEDFKGDLAQVKDEKGRVGCINREGMEVIECKYRSITPFFNGSARFQSYEGSGLLDKKGRVYHWLTRF